MRLAGLAVFGSLLINMVFGLAVAGGMTAARPVAALHKCGHHAVAAPMNRPAGVQYLAAVRMGWTVS